MEDLMKYGITEKIFSLERVMNFLYGRLECRRRRLVSTNCCETFYEWHDHMYGIDVYIKYDWCNIPLEQRMEVISLLIKHCMKGDYFNDSKCFHLRIMCLLYRLLNDKNRLECIDKADGYTMRYRRYDAIIDEKLQQNYVSEMFLWWYLGVRKSTEERQLLKKCWIKFLGCELPLSQKRAVEVVKQKISELETQLKMAERTIRLNNKLIDKKYADERKLLKKRHFSKLKKEFLLAQLEEKKDAAQLRLMKANSKKDEFQTALDFLRGFLDYVSATAKLRQKANS